MSAAAQDDLPLRELLLHLLEYTATDVIDEIWPDNELTLDDITGRILDRYAHELAEKIRNSGELRDYTDDHMGDCNAAADLIDPEGSSDGS